MANPEPQRISETQIRDGKGGMKVVRPGDKADLSKEADNLAFLRDWLGEGPYTISWIGEWPCGRVMLYLTAAGGAGVLASNFVTVD